MAVWCGTGLLNGSDLGIAENADEARACSTPGLVGLRTAGGRRLGLLSTTVSSGAPGDGGEFTAAGPCGKVVPDGSN